MITPALYIGKNIGYGFELEWLKWKVTVGYVNQKI